MLLLCYILKGKGWIKQISTACSTMIQIKVLQQPTYTVTTLHTRALAMVCLKTVTVNGRRRKKTQLQCGGCENETWWRRVWHCHCVCSVTAGSGSLLVTTAKQKSMENKFQGEREGWEKAYLPPISAWIASTINGEVTSPAMTLNCPQLPVNPGWLKIVD